MLVSPVLVLAVEVGGVGEATGRRRQLLGQPLVTLLPEDGTRGQLGVATDTPVVSIYCVQEDIVQGSRDGCVISSLHGQKI